MKVFKFGGASVSDAVGIRNLTNIVSQETGNLIVVVSAFGKTTNSLERVLNACLADNHEYIDMLTNIFLSHLKVLDDLLPSDTSARDKINQLFIHLKEFLSSERSRDFDFNYDQIVSIGELWSTIIIAEYMRSLNSDVEWVDIRNILITDNRFRDANLIWDESEYRAKGRFDFARHRVYVTQGFIGCTASGDTTTLGREGSDYTAAILANMLDAESAVVWKDVPGILNADPKWLPDTHRLDEISYREAVEMTFSGAKVIHPKTIKPLHNKGIPLYVKSFMNPSEAGTVIKSDVIFKKVIPVYVKKEEQILISILPKDLSFAMGDNLSMVFHLFTKNKIRVTLVQASAVSLNVCADDERSKVDKLIDDLKPEFSIVFNENVEMLTIRHYDTESVERITKGREILLEQRTRSTVRFVVR